MLPFGVRGIQYVSSLQCTSGVHASDCTEYERAGSRAPLFGVFLLGLTVGADESGPQQKVRQVPMPAMQSSRHDSVNLDYFT